MGLQRRQPVIIALRATPRGRRRAAGHEPAHRGTARRGGDLAVAAGRPVRPARRFRAGVDLVQLRRSPSSTAGQPRHRPDPRRLRRSSRTGSRRRSAVLRRPRQRAGPRLRLGLLLDTSGSMDEDLKLARSAAIKFLNRCREAEDITLVDFDTEVRVARYASATSRAWSSGSAAASPTAGPRSTTRSASTSTAPTTRTGRTVLVHLHRWRRHAQRDSASATPDHAAQGVGRHGLRGRLPRAHRASAHRELRMRLQQITEATGGLAFFPSRLEGPRRGLRAGRRRDAGPVPARLRVDQPGHRRRLAQGGDHGEAPRPQAARAARGTSRATVQAGTRPTDPDRCGYRCPGMAACRHRCAGGVPARPACRPSSTTASHSSPTSSCAATRPRAVPELVDGLERGDKHQVLLGVTGSGKTFTMAQVIARGEPADAGDGPQQDAGGAALPGVPAVLPAATPSSTSSATTTTTSPRPTSRPPTPTSRRNRRSTTRSTACGCRRRGRCSSAAT